MPHPVQEHFFFQPLGAKAFYWPLDDLQATVAPLLVTPATVFRHNLHSVIETARLPVRLVSAAVYQRRFSAIHMAERIRARSILEGQETPEVDAIRDQEALKLAQEQFRDKLADPSFAASARAETADALLASRKHDEAVATGARELLRQAASLTWAALEILTRDVFIAVLNARPNLVKDLLTKEGVKTFFQLKAVPLEALDTYGYDLSNRMGDFLADHRAIDSVSAMKTVLRVLIPDQQLSENLAKRDLWLLNQRRHLIVHRRGIVDPEYLTNAGDNLPLGSELVVTPDELEAYLIVVRDTGVRVLHASTLRLQESTGAPDL